MTKSFSSQVLVLTIYQSDGLWPHFSTLFVSKLVQFECNDDWWCWWWFCSSCEKYDVCMNGGEKLKHNFFTKKLFLVTSYFSLILLLVCLSPLILQVPGDSSYSLATAWLHLFNSHFPPTTSTNDCRSSVISIFMDPVKMRKGERDENGEKNVRIWEQKKKEEMTRVSELAILNKKDFSLFEDQFPLLFIHLLFTSLWIMSLVSQKFSLFKW